MLFYYTSLSEYCSYKPLELMWDMTLPQFLDEKEFVDISDAVKFASQKDFELRTKN